MDNLQAFAGYLVGVHWVWVLTAVVVVSWLWEDAAVLFAALLSLDGQLTLVAAFSASFIGVVSGDLGLYLLGRCGYRWQWLRRWLSASTKNQLLSDRFRDKTFSNIFIIRFIPGLRTLGFTFCGLWRVPAGRFMWAMLTAGLVWIGFIFGLIHLLGMSDVVRHSQWKWSLMVAAALMLIFNNLWATRLMSENKPFGREPG